MAHSATLPTQSQHQRLDSLSARARAVAFTHSIKPPAPARRQRIVVAAQPPEHDLIGGRRHILQAGCSTLLLPAAGFCGASFAATAEEATSVSSSSTAAGLVPYVNKQQQYRLSIPAGWEKKDKAGADVLFEDPSRRSTSVGVTVSPVRIASIEQFGDLATVGQRLLEAEGKKESTLDVKLLSSISRKGSAGATLYDFEYELNSTRGLKRIHNTVTITGSKLYILNANFKCDKEAGPCSAEGTLAVLASIAASFDAGGSRAGGHASTAFGMAGNTHGHGAVSCDTMRESTACDHLGGLVGRRAYSVIPEMEAG